ncbi:uncharacterized protein LOC5520275 isoform X2 [Nematostella vectensis]|uniref:uncharacterized protein LOC5520275 isoform X2 n=1 Tax=Nematostella vectensis TaxID=45351 RepID=UPI00138FC51B|nr:uncharacterized protein LOC5520275 isoform X2 [Nematostella vectensis]
MTLAYFSSSHRYMEVKWGGGYRRRWFYLEGKQLTYYKAPERTQENLLGLIDLSRAKSVNPVKVINNGFQIVTGNRTYHLSAPTPELVTDWVSVLRQAMQIKSFSGSRAKLSQKSPSTVSQPSFDEDDIYDQVEEPVFQEKEAGYESIGPSLSVSSEKSVLSTSTTPSDTVTQDANNSPGSTELGTYGLAGEPGINGVQIEQTYESIGEALGMANNGTCDATYATVISHKERKDSGDGVSEVTLLSDRDPKTLSLICESDTDENEPETEIVEKAEEDKGNPLPSPIGDVYAADQIKVLLGHDMDGRGGSPSDKSNTSKQTGSDLIIPQSCEVAFTNLRAFLKQLDEKGY